MTGQDFKTLYSRELDNLHKEISLYEDENKIWEIKGDIKNAPGNLCLHLLGNINHHVGAVLGKNGYVRQREEEFTKKGISKEQLLSDITSAKAVVENVFPTLEESKLQEPYPLELFGKQSTEFMMTYFLGHLMYHLGQITYHRRLV